MISEGIQIRGAEPEDVDGIHQVLSQPKVIWGTLQMPYANISRKRKHFEQAIEGNHVLVALSDGELIGIAGLQPIKESRRTHVATVGIAIHDDYSGRGVGRSLMQALLDLADKWLELKRLELVVWSDNSRAIGLYESLGFEREGYSRAYVLREGQHIDAIAMARVRM